MDENAKEICKGVLHVAEIVKIQQGLASSDLNNINFNLSDLINDAIAILKEAQKKHNIRTRVNIDDKIPALNLPRNPLLQLMINLLKNSTEAIRERKKSELFENIISIRASLLKDDKVSITIIDNGCGIEPDKLKNIFNFGYSTKYRGSGFGLHSAANFIQSIGGFIEVNSKGLNKGCSLKVTFPTKIT